MPNLDYARARTLRMSNDTFYYLRDNEEPLDEANIEEAMEIIAMFPDGFELDKNAVFIENSDLVEVAVIPYGVESDGYDLYHELAKGYVQQLKFTRGGTHVQVWADIKDAGERKYIGEFKLGTGHNRNVGIGFAIGGWRNGKGCLFWLKHYKENFPGAMRGISPDITDIL